MREVSGVVVIQRQDGKVLGVSRGRGVNRWGLPGGRVEAGETPAEGAARELMEETGLELEDGALLTVLKSPDREVYVVFATRVIGRAKTYSDEGDVRWKRWGALIDETPFRREILAIMRAIDKADLQTVATERRRSDLP